MAFHRGRAARAEIEAESTFGGDLYAFLDEEPSKPAPRSRRSDPGPGSAARRASPPRISPSRGIEGPLLPQGPLEDVFVFIGEASPPRRRRSEDLRRRLAELWWRWTQQRRREQLSGAIRADGELAPDCDYQQLSEGPGDAPSVSSTANSFRDFWLSLGGGPISLGDTHASNVERRATAYSAGYSEGADRRGRGSNPAGLMPSRSRSLFAPRASDRYHVLADGPSQDPQSDDEFDRNHWAPSQELQDEIAMMVRMGELPHLMGTPWGLGAAWDNGFVAPMW
mmetsp:Transcript_51064/g.114748  ORF Transcript_51064/g.114748 Transcript_51064/m.114748 type:complete len:281 (+) Transcript_51064:27-869(+)